MSGSNLGEPVRAAPLFREDELRDRGMQLYGVGRRPDCGRRYEVSAPRLQSTVPGWAIRVRGPSAARVHRAAWGGGSRRPDSTDVVAFGEVVSRVRKRFTWAPTDRANDGRPGPALRGIQQRACSAGFRPAWRSRRCGRRLCPGFRQQPWTARRRGGSRAPIRTSPGMRDPEVHRSRRPGYARRAA